MSRCIQKRCFCACQGLASLLLLSYTPQNVQAGKVFAVEVQNCMVAFWCRAWWDDWNEHLSVQSSMTSQWSLPHRPVSAVLGKRPILCYVESSVSWVSKGLTDKAFFLLIRLCCAAQVSWVQPRVLTNPQISALKDRLDGWIGKVSSASLALEEGSLDVMVAWGPVFMVKIPWCKH